MLNFDDMSSEFRDNFQKMETLWNVEDILANLIWTYAKNSDISETD